MTIIITAKYDNDPRARRVVIAPSIAVPFVEVCERDARNAESWRYDKNPPTTVIVECMLRRGLELFARKYDEGKIGEADTLGRPAITLDGNTVHINLGLVRS